MNLSRWDLLSNDMIPKKLKRTMTNSLYGLNSDHCWIDEPLNNAVLSHTIIDELIEHFRKIEEEKQNKMIIESAKAIINGNTYKVMDMRIAHEVGTYPTAELTVSLNPLNMIPSGVIIHKTGGPVKSQVKPVTPGIDKVIFNYPAAIVFWEDGTKTIVKCKPGDQWDPHAGISAAIAKKFFGTQVNKWVKKAEYAKKPPVDGGDK